MFMSIYNSPLFFKELGNRISKYRKEIGLTQEQLAEKIGVSQEVIAYYETGKRRLTLSLLIPLKNALFVDIEDLLGIKKGKGKPGPIPKIQKRLEQIQNLPLNKQKIVLELLDSFIESNIKILS